MNITGTLLIQIRNRGLTHAHVGSTTYDVQLFKEMISEQCSRNTLRGTRNKQNPLLWHALYTYLCSGDFRKILGFMFRTRNNCIFFFATDTFAVISLM
jgi:hypothetical protein